MRILGLLVNHGSAQLHSVAGAANMQNTHVLRDAVLQRVTLGKFLQGFDAGAIIERELFAAHFRISPQHHPDVAVKPEVESGSLAGLAHRISLAQSGPQRFTTKEALA